MDTAIGLQRQPIPGGERTPGELGRASGLRALGDREEVIRDHSTASSSSLVDSLQREEVGPETKKMEHYHSKVTQDSQNSAQ